MLSGMGWISALQERWEAFLALPVKAGRAELPFTNERKQVVSELRQVEKQ